MQMILCEIFFLSTKKKPEGGNYKDYRNEKTKWFLYGRQVFLELLKKQYQSFQNCFLKMYSIFFSFYCTSSQLAYSVMLVCTIQGFNSSIYHPGLISTSALLCLHLHFKHKTQKKISFQKQKSYFPPFPSFHYSL